MYSHCYAIGKYIATGSEQWLGNCIPVEADKHVNDIRAITRQLPITTVKELLGVMFFVGSAPGLYNNDSRPEA
jgi:hypothetical protein